MPVTLCLLVAPNVTLFANLQGRLSTRLDIQRNVLQAAQDKWGNRAHWNKRGVECECELAPAMYQHPSLLHEAITYVFSHPHILLQLHQVSPPLLSQEASACLCHTASTYYSPLASPVFAA